MIWLWAQFIICAGLIFICGEKTAFYGTGIAKKLSISEGLVGFFFLAIITSLPEFIAGIGSVTAVDASDFAVGDAFGSMFFNLLIIAMLEFQQSKKTGLPLLVNVEQANILTILATNLLLVICAVSILTRKQWDGFFDFFHLGYESFLLIFLCVFFSKKIFASQKVHFPEADIERRGGPEKDYIWPKFFFTAVIIVISGLRLAVVGEKIVTLTGLSMTLFGTVFLAIATSLPEVFVASAALRHGLRIGKPLMGINMAVGNVLGSNFFDVMIIPLCDIFYRKGALLSNVALDNNVTILFVIIFGSLVAWGIKSRRRRLFWRFGAEIAVMVITALAAIIILFSVLKK